MKFLGVGGIKYEADCPGVEDQKTVDGKLLEVSEVTKQPNSVILRRKEERSPEHVSVMGRELKKIAQKRNLRSTRVCMLVSKYAFVTEIGQDARRALAHWSRTRANVALSSSQRRRVERSLEAVCVVRIDRPEELGDQSRRRHQF